jgi:hypothetical protein
MTACKLQACIWARVTKIKLCKAYHPSISLHARHFLLPHFSKNTVVPVEKFAFELNSFNAFNANLTALIISVQILANWKIEFSYLATLKCCCVKNFFIVSHNFEMLQCKEFLFKLVIVLHFSTWRLSRLVLHHFLFRPETWQLVHLWPHIIIITVPAIEVGSFCK